MNARMSESFEAIDRTAREEDVPDPFRAIVRAGWTSEGDALLLSALHFGYSGTPLPEFGDVIHYEASVNGRGMMDYDIPESDPERHKTLLRRSLGYACTALLEVPGNCPWPMFGYISLSEGGLEDDLLTAHVTFCSARPGLPPYVDDMDSYKHEALLEVSQDDAKALLRKSGAQSR
ncbi:hypothetical protein [Streptomyces sp. N50]|uniref:hypothetical protein n=1 Tax=Streptomyces sp. N50 TaxID=3081765 RepID=UPI00296218EE|nr:hypothetical protein [Streptomyces sp. N50]WOX12130.1 hypothetical protein R2B38_26315 [Streptomyces sp. N50]